MNHQLLSLYNSLPGSARSVAASLRGLRLRSWRYGPETQRLVKNASEREHWSHEKWKSWQEKRLEYVLHRAATRVPYYRDLWARRRRKGDGPSWEHLENWPVLEKETLRKCSRAFLADDIDPRRMYHEGTSGTTGTPLDLWRSRQTMRERYALCELRLRQWYGVSRNDRWAMLGGQLVTPVDQRTPPFWVWNAPMKQLYMSSYHLAPDLIPHYLDALRRYRIHYLWGYTSSLNALAQEILRQREDDLNMAVVITNAEPLLDHQRQAIEGAFRCPVRETYGMAELVAAASECEAGQLHLWPEVGIVEIMKEGQLARTMASGELVCTGLLNVDMPLIRYRVGDRGAKSELDSSSCDCGRTLPALASIDGRNDEVLYTTDGRPVGRLDPIFKEQLPIREAQIIQEELTVIRVRYVPTAQWTDESSRLITTRLYERLGRVDIQLERVDQVPRSPNGKFRAVICNVRLGEDR